MEIWQCCAAFACYETLTTAFKPISHKKTMNDENSGSSQQGLQAVSLPRETFATIKRYLSGKHIGFVVSKDFF